MLIERKMRNTDTHKEEHKNFSVCTLEIIILLAFEGVSTLRFMSFFSVCIQLFESEVQILPLCTPFLYPHSHHGAPFYRDSVCSFK